MSEYPVKSTAALDDDVLGVLLAAVAPAMPPPGLRARVLDRVQGAQRAAAFLTLDAQQGWCELLPGVEVKRLFVDTQRGTKSFLLRARAGVSLPPHGHQGCEECLVLEGEFTLGDLTLRAGDYHLAPAGSEHPAAATHCGVTVYLRAAIADYPGV